MDDLIVSSILGKKVLGVTEYAEFYIPRIPDLKNLFVPGKVYDAKMLERQGDLFKIEVEGQVFYAESKVDINDTLPENVRLKFLDYKKDIFTFKIIGEAAPDYSIEFKPSEITDKLKAFIPTLSKEELGVFLKLLPQLQESLFEDLVVFKYLANLDFNKVKEKILPAEISKNNELQKNSQTINNDSLKSSRPFSSEISPEPFKKILYELLGQLLIYESDFSNIKDTTPEKQGGGLFAQLKDLVTDIVKLVDKMIKNVNTAKNVNTFVDKETPILKEHIKTLKQILPQIATEITDKSNFAFKDKDAVLLNKIENFSEFVSRELNTDTWTEKVYKSDGAKWMNIFAFSVVDPSSFIKEFKINERAQDENKEEKPKEYQVTLEFNFKQLGSVRVILYWMNNTLSARVECKDPATYTVFNNLSTKLEGRLKMNDININSIKLEYTSGGKILNSKL